MLESESFVSGMWRLCLQARFFAGLIVRHFLIKYVKAVCIALMVIRLLVSCYSVPYFLLWFQLPDEATGL